MLDIPQANNTIAPANRKVNCIVKISAITPAMAGINDETTTADPNTNDTVVAWTSWLTTSTADARIIAISGKRNAPPNIRKKMKVSPDPAHDIMINDRANTAKLGGNIERLPQISDKYPRIGWEMIPLMFMADRYIPTLVEESPRSSSMYIGRKVITVAWAPP